MLWYNEACLRSSRVSLGPTYMFEIDKCLTCTYLINQDVLNEDFINKLCLYRIMVYSGFSLYMFHCILDNALN